MPILRIRLKMSILHQCIVFEKSLPIFIVFSIVRRGTSELFDSDLVTIIVLENKVREIWCLRFFFEFDLDVALARPLSLCVHFT